MFPILTVLALTPLVGALILLVPAITQRAAKTIAFLVSLVTLGLAGVSAALFLGRNTGEFVLTETVPWIPQFGAYYALGLDGLGLLMVLMTAILVPIVLLASWRIGEPTETEEPPKLTAKSFFGIVLVLESISLYVFLATDVLLFYVLFELTLIPMYFLIAGWGKGRKRSYAAIKFLLFSLAGGLIMLVAVVALYLVTAANGRPTFLLSDLRNLDLPLAVQIPMFLAFMAAFAIKAPLVPLHTWLPDAVEESTPGGATIMVAVLDKIGAFGMLRFCLGLFPDASKWATPVVLILAVISIIWGALGAIGQRNLMRLVAYSSVSHFGFIILGIFAFTQASTAGAALYLVNHGFSTAALFLALGFLISRGGSALIADYGGVQKVAPVLAGLTLVAGLSSLALPGLASFVSEFLVLSGTFARYPVHAAVATLGIVLAALYVLLMYQKVFTGPTPERVQKRVTEISLRERLTLAPLILLIIGLGIVPRPVLQLITPTVTSTLTRVGVAEPEKLGEAMQLPPQRSEEAD